MRHETSLVVGILAISSLAFPLSPTGASIAAEDPIAFEEPLVPSTSPTRDLEQAADLASARAEKLPDVYTGVRLDPDNNRLIVALTDGPDAEAHEAAILQDVATAGLAQKVELHFDRVKYSRKAMEQTRVALESLLIAETFRGRLVAVGQAASRGVAVVYATQDSEAMRRDLKNTYGDKIVFRRMDPPIDAIGTRHTDQQNASGGHYGGAGIGFWNEPNTGYCCGGELNYCSTGFPVTLSGVRYMLTAGHCLPGSTPYPKAWATTVTTVGASDAYYFGTLTTTTAQGTLYATQGTQHLYGDWALISRNGQFDPRVYNGPPTGTSGNLKVDRARWVNPQEGDEWCSSGRTTGQVCRLFITDAQTMIQICNPAGCYTTGQIAAAKSNQRLLPAFDCEGPIGGDSGGAFYRGTSEAGRIEVAGIFKGFIESPELCEYWFTKINGLREWNPNVNVVFSP